MDTLLCGMISTFKSSESFSVILLMIFIDFTLLHMHPYLILIFISYAF